MNCVHPFMLILDIHSFLETVCQRRKTNRISLLLYHAVMFSAAAYVDIEHLQDAGYPDRKAARKCLFQKASLFHYVLCEPDKTALMQALLLMSHVDETVEQKNNWYWLGVCHSLALANKLHEDPRNWCSNINRRRLYKRLWWCIYVRDRLIALELKYPMRIQDSDHNVSWLTTDDFTFQPFSRHVIGLLDDSEILQSTTQQRDLVIMFIEKTKLGVCLGRVLSTQYSMSAYSNRGDNPATTLAPKESTTQPFTTRQCDWELEDWMRQLPPRVKHRSESGDVSFIPNILHFHRALLWLFYLGAVSVLHRPHVVPSPSYIQDHKELYHLSQGRVRSSAADITKTFQYLSNLGLTQSIPCAGVGVLFAGAISHLYDITSNERNTQMLGRAYFKASVRILQVLEDTYELASLAVSFLRTSIHSINACCSIAATHSSQSCCNAIYSSTPGNLSGKFPDCSPSSSAKSEVRMTAPRMAASISSNDPISSPSSHGEVVSRAFQTVDPTNVFPQY